MDAKNRQLQISDLHLRQSPDDAMAALHQAVVMEASTGVIIVSAMTTPKTTLFINPAYEAITGYSAAEVVGRRPGRLSRGDVDQPDLYELHRAIAEERATVVTLYNHRKDGQACWNELSISPVHDGQGRLTHWLGLLNDVSERKKAQNELISLAVRLDALTSLSTDGLMSIDKNLCVSYINTVLLKFIDLRQSDVLGLPVREFDRAFRKHCNADQTFPDICDLALNDKGKNAAWELISEMHLTSSEPRILTRRILRGSHDVSWLVYFHDITKSRQLEQMKSEFLATAAHELRTPMASIMGFAELLQQRQFDAKTLQEVLDIIVRQSRRITDLLNELLDLARIEARRGMDFKRVTTDVRNIVRAAVETRQQEPGRISLTGMDEKILVSVDTGKIQQALTNLLSNAIKFSAPDAAIAVAVKRDEAARRVGIAIQDHGIGMSPAQQERLGERFYRVDPSGSIPGTGLGVSLLKEIIHLHGGEFEPRCAAGKGCCMTVWLPIVAPEANDTPDATPSPA
jgi:PAS domain S-box-containing protein